MLVVALMLSVLNSIMGCARSLHQMSIDGQFPRIFSSVNRHGVPGFSMGFNVLFSIALVFTGGAVEIYTLSNVGYTVSFIPVLVGYYLLRKYRADMQAAGAAAGVLQVHRAVDGGRATSSSGCTAASSRRRCRTRC